MRRQRRSKIVATLGPASGERAIIARLFEAGADVFRINMSHTNHARMRELVSAIRSVEADHGRPIGILVDLQGPKLRLGAFKNDYATIDQGQDFVFDTDPSPGDSTRVHLPHPEIFAAIKPGDTLLIDDGKLRLIATDTGPQRIVARVEIGGKVSNRKGVSLPDTVIPLAALAPKDLADLEAALDAGIDWVALSFIQRPEDIAEAKKITRGRAAVMAKIEKPQAVARLQDILDLADALMVARGDLGVEMPLEKVPGVQKDMTRACRRAGKPVVVATQMLESMIASPVPTRAEVSDVATAIFDGADAVMLSAESAAGQYPVEAVATMNRIAEQVECDANYLPSLHVLHTEPEATGADAIAAAVRQVAETLDPAAIVCWTSSGSTGLRVARERPQCPIVALSPIITTGRKLSVVWGIHGVIAEDARDQDDMVERACRLAFKEGFAKAGQRIIIVAGLPLGTPGATNMVRIAFVGDQRVDE
ncbi:MAG TPA: pyruvate kinase [Xanthobacteraceae bacterium]|nr:pyruvate kinase [Xanthobacteraceae bacterium]